ncbi:RND family transporter [Fibrobacterota bacterium]
MLAFFILPDLRIEQDETMWFKEQDPILQTYRKFQEEFSTDELAVIVYPTDSALSGNELAYLKKLTGRLGDLPHVVDVMSLANVDDIRGTGEGLEIEPLVGNIHLAGRDMSGLLKRIDSNHLLKGTFISEDFNYLGIILELDWEKEDRKLAGTAPLEIVRNIKDLLGRESAAGGKRFYLGGNLVTDAEVARIIDRDMHRFFPLSVFLAALMVLLVFRSFLHMLFPVLSVVLALEWTLALKGILGSPITPVSTTLFALINVMGIANAIHLISHFNIAYGRLRNTYQAMRETFQRAGRACFFTSATTALGFGSLGVSSLPIIRDMGLFAAFGIMSAFVISIILVPFGLMLFTSGKRNYAPKELNGLKVMLKAVAGFDLRHPWLIILVCALLSLVMAAGVFQIRVESSMLKYLKEESLLRQDAELLDSVMVGVSSVEVVIKGEPDDFKDPGNLKKIEFLQQMAVDHISVAVSHSVVDYLKLIFRAINSDNPAYFRIPDTREAVAQSLLLYEMSGGKELSDYVSDRYDEVRISVRTRQMEQAQREALLADINAYADTGLKEFATEVTGYDNLVYETTNRIILTEVQSISLALGVILCLMCLVFGVRGGLISILPNIFPIVFLLGIMGYAGFSLNVATAIIASIAIGIVVDDTIHYFYHYKHELKECGRGDQALTEAHTRVGSALCFTSASLVLGFGIFLFSETHILVDYGLLSGLAVVVALFGDLFFGPVLLLKLKAFQQKKGDRHNSEENVS